MMIYLEFIRLNKDSMMSIYDVPKSSIYALKMDSNKFNGGLMQIKHLPVERFYARHSNHARRDTQTIVNGSAWLDFWIW